MSVTDDDRHPDDDVHQAKTDPVRRWNRQIVIGAVGLAAVLGAGAYVMTDRLTDKGSSTSEAGSLAPLGATPGPADSVPAPAPAPAKASGSGPTSAPPTGAAKPWQSMSPDEQNEVRKRIKAAQDAMVKRGVKLTHALEANPRPGATGKAVTSTIGSLNGEGITRVTTAKFDLTGQKDLLWAADSGKTVGKATCTQKFRFSRNAPARELPTMLMCWRTSAAKSVVTVTVEKKGRPSVQDNVATLAREWAKMK